MSDNKKVEDVTAEKPKTEQELAQSFIKEYETLCEKHGYQIVVNPAFRARDDGTFSVVLQTSVGKLPKK
jgi:hypothetical protein